MCDLAALKKVLLREEELSPGQAYQLAGLDDSRLEELLEVAGAITRHYFQRQISLCAICSAKTGKCANDCGFCAQSAHHNCDIKPHGIDRLEPDLLLARLEELSSYGVSSFAFVTSGEALNEGEFARILELYRLLKAKTSLSLCASLGMLSPSRARALKQAGVSRYHHNLETARSFFPQICTTHSYDSKLKTIRVAQSEGLKVCSGGIISLGETLEQRIELALDLRMLDVDCIPINILNPIPGTRLESQPLLSVEEILKSIAIFRLILPKKTLKFAGGRENALGEDEYRGYNCGINSAIFGDYLTTMGKSYQEGLRRLTELGFSIYDPKANCTSSI